MENKRSKKVFEEKFISMRRQIKYLQESIWSQVKADDIAAKVIQEYEQEKSSARTEEDEYVSDCESFTRLSVVGSDVPTTTQIQTKLTSMRKLLENLHTKGKS